MKYSNSCQFTVEKFTRLCTDDDNINNVIIENLVVGIIQSIPKKDLIKIFHVTEHLVTPNIKQWNAYINIE